MFIEEQKADENEKEGEQGAWFRFWLASRVQEKTLLCNFFNTARAEWDKEKTKNCFWRPISIDGARKDSAVEKVAPSLPLWAADDWKMSQE